jgi:hypothetical protein
MEDFEGSKNPLAEDGNAPAPPAYSGVVLLGWMAREKAIRFLMEDCWFEQPLNPEEAESLWLEWRQRAASLPERPISAPQQFPFNDLEKAHAERYLAYMKSQGAGTEQVFKIDPMQLAVAQYQVVVEIAASHGENCLTDADWFERSLPLATGNPNLDIRFSRNHLDTEIEIDLPHAEFFFGMHPQGGFGPRQLLRDISVLSVGSRLVLARGYHRLYGRVMSVDGRLPDRLSLVALDPGTLTPPASSEAASSVPFEDAGLDIFGKRAPLFADFFTEGLAMPVYLKRKRYQLQVRARWVATNYPETGPVASSDAL